MSGVMILTEMLASEQFFFSHSPPGGFLSDYSPPPPLRRLPQRGISAPCLPTLKTVHLNLKTAPRSCLLRADAEKGKKKVVFADDRGFALEQVRILTEPSHVPPFWTLKVTETLEPKKTVNNPVDRWEMLFKQPASNYLEFRERIEQKCVSLENVIVKERECALDGTVKVKNLDFNKEVFLRASSDGWQTSEDTYCAFLGSGPPGTNYDTFGFRVPLPIHSRRLDFCVCFRCTGEEFWDSNDGQNYTIERKSAIDEKSNFCARFNLGNSWHARGDSAATPYW